MTAPVLTRTHNGGDFYYKFYLHPPTPNAPEGNLVTHVFNKAFDGTLQPPPTELQEINIILRPCSSSLLSPRISDLSYKNKHSLVNSEFNSIILQSHSLTVTYSPRVENLTTINQ